MILLVHSNRDIAGKNIAKTILKQYPFKKTSHTYQNNPVYTAQINQQQVTFITLDQEAVYAQTLPEDFPEAKLTVFISRHSSQSGTPTLSVHTPGNLAEAELGGLPRTVSVSPAAAMQTALKTLSHLNHERKLGFEVSYECTHHGPSLNVPTMFVELGSSEKQWNDLAAAEAVGEAAVKAISEFGKPAKPAAIGIGGTHYNRKFTQMAIEDKATFGHMVPKYALAKLDAEMMQQCIQKTREKVEHAVLDWKGIKSEDKPSILAALNEVGLHAKRV